MRPVSRRGADSASATVMAGRLLSLVVKLPCTWQQRMRTSSMTGVLEASESSKPSSTALTIDGRFGARVEQPDLALHGEGVAALLHDGGALAVVFADDDQRAAGDAARGEIGQRIRGDIGADRRFEGRRAADRIMHRRRQHGGRRSLRSARLEMHAELAQNVLRVGKHVHQMADRRALVAADIADAVLQQRLGDGEDALARERSRRRRAGASRLP